MTLQEIKTAVMNGKTVYWSNEAYKVICDKHNQWLIVYTPTSSCIGLTHTDEITMNGKEEDFFIQQN